MKKYFFLVFVLFLASCGNFSFHSKNDSNVWSWERVKTIQKQVSQHYNKKEEKNIFWKKNKYVKFENFTPEDFDSLEDKVYVLEWNDFKCSLLWIDTLEQKKVRYDFFCPYRKVSVKLKEEPKLYGNKLVFSVEKPMDTNSNNDTLVDNEKFKYEINLDLLNPNNGFATLDGFLIFKWNKIVKYVENSLDFWDWLRGIESNAPNKLSITIPENLVKYKEKFKFIKNKIAKSDTKIGVLNKKWNICDLTVYNGYFEKKETYKLDCKNVWLEDNLFFVKAIWWKSPIKFVLANNDSHWDTERYYFYPDNVLYKDIYYYKIESWNLSLGFVGDEFDYIVKYDDSNHYENKFYLLLDVDYTNRRYILYRDRWAWIMSGWKLNVKNAKVLYKGEEENLKILPNSLWKYEISEKKWNLSESGNVYKFVFETNDGLVHPYVFTWDKYWIKKFKINKDDLICFDDGQCFPKEDFKKEEFNPDYYYFLKKLQNCVVKSSPIYQDSFTGYCYNKTPSYEEKIMYKEDETSTWQKQKVKFYINWNEVVYIFLSNEGMCGWWDKIYKFEKWWDVFKNYLKYPQPLNINGFKYDLSLIRFKENAQFDLWIDGYYLNLVVDGNKSLNELLKEAYKKYYKYDPENWINIPKVVRLIYKSSYTHLPFDVIILYSIDDKFLLQDDDIFKETYPLVDKAFVKKYGNRKIFKVKFTQLWKYADYLKSDTDVKDDDIFTCEAINSDFWLCRSHRELRLMAEMCKPAIYFYWMDWENNKLIINLPQWGYFTKLIPQFNIGSGWKFDVKDNKVMFGENKYNYLYYAVKVYNYKFNKKGWIVKWDKIEKFFNEKLDYIGFNKQEKKDFLDYWKGKYNKDSYYFISFKFNEDFGKYSKLKLTKKYNKLFRVLMETYEVKQFNKNFVYPTNFENKLNKEILEKFDRTNNKEIFEWWGVFIDLNGNVYIF